MTKSPPSRARARPGLTLHDAWDRMRESHQRSLVVGAELERLTQIRDAAMAMLHRAGHSYQAIAQEVGLTRGRVAQIVRRQKATGATIETEGGGQKKQV